MIYLPSVYPHYRTAVITKPSEIVRKSRKLLQLNQKDFANRLGKTQSLLSKYESGKVHPPADIIMHCMNILNDAEPASADIEEIISKIKALEGEQHAKLREAINLLLDRCLHHT